ncbi:MAG: response regulator [Thermoproteota archaeon]|nr:response regulator [Thermoproteota archaeon]
MNLITRKKRVLLVDDEPDITETFTLALEDSGLYEVYTYNDPIVALSQFRSNFYDLALLDIRMPGMNGFELYNGIQKKDKHIKVCFVSAFSIEDRALRKQFPMLKTKCFLPKPIAIKVLLEKLEIELLR